VPVTDLYLEMEKENWLAAADEIRRGRCKIQMLTLAMRQTTRSEVTEAVKAVTSAIMLDRNLEHVTLRMENGFTDQAGVASAEALTVNKTLEMITLSGDFLYYLERNRAELGVPAYGALRAMLRVNTSLVLNLPPFDNAVGDQRLVDSRNQMRIE
jgi:hypothetical protein